MITKFNEQQLEYLCDAIDVDKQEGVVIRNIESFHFDDFETNVAKWVRAKHIQTDEHWMTQKVIPNGILSKM